MNTHDDNIEYGLFLNALEKNVTELVKSRLNGDYEITHNMVLKNNSVELTALTIRERGAVSAPNIFLDSYYHEYQKGRDISDISGDVLNVFLENKDRLDVSTFDDFSFEKLKERIFFKLVNFSLNLELLKSLPYIQKGDLALIFACLIEHKGDGISSVRIDNSLMEKWNTNAEELYELARVNSTRLFPPKVFTLNTSNLTALLENRMSDPGIENILESKQDGILCGYELADDISMLYVLTNTDGIDGAACIAYEGLLERIYRKLGTEFFILPSSVHEVIILPDNGKIEASGLSRMVNEINHTTLSAMDVLSDRVYHYPQDVFDSGTV
ncbi:MAG: DUF5688 family protein [Lachnospiraceae bacterium]|nr:DUF5688 family protein [Lachnospiraceae bacterium]